MVEAMDTEQVNQVFRLCYKAADLEEDAIRNPDLSRNNLMAAQHYSQAMEILLSLRPGPICKTVLSALSAMILKRMERLAANQLLPANGAAITKDPARDQKRRRVAQEFLDTEKSFHTFVRRMIDSYMAPMKKLGILSDEESIVAFASCTQIAGLSEQLISNLEARMSKYDPVMTTLGDLLLLYADFFKMYIPYANNFARGQQLLDSKNYQQISDAAAKAGVDNLASLRIMPIQRIPRYVILTTELLKYTPDGHRDKPLLEDALKKIEDIAKTVNARMAASDMEAKVLEIQSSLWCATGSIPDLVAPGRRLIKEGAVAKVSTAGGIKRNYYLFCFDDIVVYATTNPLFRNKFHFHKALDYYGAFPADEEVKNLGLSLRYGESAFKITGSNGYRIFIAGSDAKRKDWLRALTEMVDVKEQKRRTWTRAKGEVMEADDEEAVLDD